MIPGLDGSDEHHWQSYQETSLPAVRIQPTSWTSPDLPDWTNAITRAVEAKPRLPRPLPLADHTRLNIRPRRLPGRPTGPQRPHVPRRPPTNLHITARQTPRRPSRPDSQHQRPVLHHRSRHPPLPSLASTTDPPDRPRPHQLPHQPHHLTPRPPPPNHLRIRPTHPLNTTARPQRDRAVVRTRKSKPPAATTGKAPNTAARTSLRILNQIRGRTRKTPATPVPLSTTTQDTGAPNPAPSRRSRYAFEGRRRCSNTVEADQTAAHPGPNSVRRGLLQDFSAPRSALSRSTCHLEPVRPASDDLVSPTEGL